MSRPVVIGFFAIHVLAITIAAIPNPQALPVLERSRLRPDDAIAVRLTPAADFLGEAIIRWSRKLWRATGMVRAGTSPYIGLTAQHQRWHMFSGPVTVNEYVRARYFIARPRAGGGQPSWVATELIFPSHPPNGWQVVESFRLSFRDKSIMTALSDFRAHLAAAQLTRTLPDDLAPVAAYFSRAFAQRLQPDERVIRTEIWYGTEPIAPPGQLASTPAIRPESEPTEHHTEMPPFAPAFGRERTGSISWVMFYAGQ
jgi:hypothetical protein